ncbi:MAG: alpha/beta hydrolase domain-containing protein [Propionibacteriales bacterium]|nr:alpha/beta hydrolase domain-containing protein [Propionibacteriales bacterium]
MSPLTFRPLPPGPPQLAAVSPGPDLAAAGFAETEYVVSGTAWRHVAAPGPDGGAVRGDEASFATRIVVRAPVDVASFSGVVVVEWLNVSSGSDAAPDYTYLAEEIVRRRHAWVGVSAQQLGVVGGRPSIGGDPSTGLAGSDPARYGDLTHPGDAYSYDMFGRIAAALGRGAGPLAEHPVTRLIAVGESQSAFALTTYINTVVPTGDVFEFDAYLVHSRGRAELGLGDVGRPHDLDAVRSGPPAPFRGDLRAPVIVVQTETDVLSSRFRYVDARQEDGPLLRVWEVAGTAHADLWQIGEFESLLGCPEPVNRGQQAYVLRAALRSLETWAAGEGAPPAAEGLAVEPDQDRFEVDAVGNVRGGVRTPCVDAPVQVLTGLAPPDASVLCSLFGATRELADDVLRARHRSVEHYLEEYAAATDAAIAAGFVLPEDRVALLAEARPDLVAATVGPPRS